MDFPQNMSMEEAFALAEAVALCVVTIGFGVSRIIRK